MIRLIRIFRLLLRLAGRLALLAIVFAVLAIVFLGFTSTGTQIVAEKVADLASVPGRIVTIKTESSLLGGAVRAPEITVSDSAGAYLRVSGLAVDWSPAALLRGVFKAQSIRVDRVDYLRPALMETAPPPEPSEPFRLPIALDLEQVDVPDIHLGAAVAGREFSVAATGSAQADRDNILMHLSANRQDDPDAKAVAEVAFVPGDNRLTLKASLDEPKNGLIVTLLKLPDNPALHLTVDGKGPLSDWSGRFVAALDGADAFSMDMQHQALENSGHRLAFKGSGAAQALMPATVRELFAGETSFAFDIDIGASGRLDIRRGTLASSSTTMSASGTYDPDGENSLVAHMSGVENPMTIRLADPEQATSFSVRSVDIALSGKSDNATLNARADLKSVDYPGIHLEDMVASVTGKTFDLAKREGPLLAKIAFERGTFENPDLARLLPGPLAIEAPLELAADIVTVKDGALESARVGGTFNGSFDRARNDLQSDLKLFALPDVLPESIAARVKDRLVLAAQVSYALNGGLSIRNIDLQSDVLTAKGEMSLLSGTFKAAVEGQLPRLDALLSDARGAAGYTLSAQGNLDAPDVKATISSQNAVLSGRTVENLVLEAEGRADLKQPSANLSVEGKLGGQPVSIHAQVKSDKGVVALPVLEGRVGSNTLEGGLRLGSDLMPEGKITFDLPDIELVAALAGEKAAGDLKGSAVFGTGDGRATAVIDAAGTSISRDTLSIVSPRVSLSITDLKALAATGRVEAEQVNAGANRVTGLKLDFDRAGKDTVFDLGGRCDGKPVVLTGAVAVEGERTRVALKRFSAVPKGVPLELAKPTDIRIENGTVLLSSLGIRAGKGTVTINGTAGATLDLKADIKSVPLSLANTFKPDLGANGTVAGSVDIKGKSSAPEIFYKIALDRAEVAQTRSAGLQPFAIKLNGGLRQGRLQVDATAANGDGLALKGGGTAAIAGNGALDLSFSGKLPFKAVSGLVASQGFVVGGNANLQVKIAGTAAQPIVTGKITSNDGSVVDVRRNLTIKNLVLGVDLDKTRAIITKLSGKLSTGGSVSVTGSVGIVSGSGFPADLDIRLDKASYVDGKIVSTVVDGAMTLTGPLAGGAKLGGNLTLGRSAITIPQKLPASLAQINVQHRNESSAVAVQNKDVMARTGKSGKGASSPIALDLTVSAPKIFVQGRGIDAELGGDLTLRGTASDPVVSGGFKMKRGRLTILSRRLDFTSGNIAFGGDLTPTLDMAAETDSGSTTITVTISGSASDPAVSFSSSPALPQDEVLAQLIFNQSLSRLSVLQIAQLADAVAQLAGGRSTSLFQSLRSNLGVDDLDVTSDESGQAKVKAGKYINDRTYIQVEQGAGSGSKASINLDVGKGIKLKGEAGSDGAGAAGIFYEKEY